MATPTHRAESAHEKPEHRWSTACAMLDMARADLDGCGDSNEEADFYTDAQLHALDELMMAPAPDAAAFARKLEIFFAEECSQYCSERKNRMEAAVLADARRLAGEARHGRA